MGRAQIKKVYIKESTHKEVLSIQKRKYIHPGIHTKKSTYKRVYIQGKYTEVYIQKKCIQDILRNLEKYI